MWPTWEKNGKELTNAAQAEPTNKGYKIDADNIEAIAEAFERIAALMSTGGVSET